MINADAGAKRFQAIGLFSWKGRNFLHEVRSVFARSALNFLVDAPPQTFHEAPARCRGFLFWNHARATHSQKL
jgi:hypothetical protein